MVELELCEATDMCNTASTHSTSWHLSDCRALASVITVDSALMEQYAQHLLSKPFLIPYKSWTTIMNALPDSSDWDVSIARSFTRLCTVMATLSQADSDNNKQVNTLYSPAGTAGDTIQTTLQAGDKKWSIYDRKGAAQQYYFLMQTLGQLNNPQGTISIKRHQFDSYKYVNAFDLEKVPQASMSGTNLATGGLLTLSMKGVGTTTSNRPNRCYVNCHYDAVCEVTASGAAIHTWVNGTDARKNHTSPRMQTLQRLRIQRVPRHLSMLRRLVSVRSRDQGDRAGARGPEVLPVLTSYK